MDGPETLGGVPKLALRRLEPPRSELQPGQRQGEVSRQRPQGGRTPQLLGRLGFALRGEELTRALVVRIAGARRRCLRPRRCHEQQQAEAVEQRHGAVVLRLSFSARKASNWCCASSARPSFW